MEFRQIDWQRDKKLIHDICYNSGSAITKKSYAYIDMLYRNPDRKPEGWILDDCAFYVVTKGILHWRLVEIAVRKDYQGKGKGIILLSRILFAMGGIKRLTFRTPMNESAIGFWQHIGARIMDVKGNDYEMEIKLK